MAFNSVIPDVKFSSAIGAGGGWTPASTLNKAASSAQKIQATVAGNGNVLGIPYGRVRVGAQISGVVLQSGRLVLRALWCMGECDAIESTWINDLAVPAGVNVTSYLGAAGQGADATLVAAYAAAGKVYSDTCPGVCYSVFSIPPGVNSGFPRLNAQIRGLKVRPTQFGTRAWSQNPALCIADFIESVDYGMGRSVDWATVATAVSACDALVGSPSEKKRVLNLMLDTPQSGETWLTQLRDYAGCWIVPEAGIYRLIPDTTGSSVMSFTTSNVLRDSVKIQLRSTLDSPTAIEVTYTETSSTPWRDATATVYASGVLAGTTARRMGRYSRPGIQRYSEAYRYAVERLNYSLINDMVVTFTAFDDALKLQVGDIFDLTHPAGLTAKLFRTAKIDPVGPGRWQITGNEYDPAVYSSVVVTGPSTPDTTTPDPSNPPAVTGLALVEELYQKQDGYIDSRIRATWNAVSGYAPSYQYEVVVTVGTQQIDYVLTNNNVYVSAGIQQGNNYTVTVYVRTSLARGAAATASITAQGKLLPPGNVPFFTGYESGGEVRLNWVPAPDIDTTAHEIRYGLTGGSFATATLLDRVAMPAIRYSTRVVPPGTWRFYIVGLDSVRTATFPYGQPSVSPKTVDILVNTNPDLFLAGDYPFVTPTLTNMLAFADELGGTNWISNNGSTWNTQFPTVLSGFGNPIFTYQSAGTSTLVTESYDFSLQVTGLFAFNPTYVDLAGTASLILELSTDNVAWTQYPGVTNANATARYARLRLTTTGVMLVTALGNVRASVATSKETGQVTSLASGPVTVTLVNKYARLKTLQLTGQDASGVRNPVYLNAVFSFDFRYWVLDYSPEDYVDEAFNPVNSFDILNYNALGNPDIGLVQYLIEGVVR